MDLTIGGVALTAALYSGGFWVTDGISTQQALARGGREANVTGLPTSGIVAVEAGIFTLADIGAQRTHWKPAPWIVRGLAVGLMIKLKVHNDRVMR